MSYREKALSEYGEECRICGEDDVLEVHHINGQRSDNTLTNLVPLCGSCHKKAHGDQIDIDGWKSGKLQYEKYDPSKNTTLTISKGSKKKLEELRHPEHHSWDQFVRGLDKIFPNEEPDSWECANCGDEPFLNGPTEQYQGLIRWTKVDYDGDEHWVSNWFCSTHCAQELDEEMASYVPEEPDNVIVGGKDELRTDVEFATFYMDREQMEVGIPIPGTFAGTDSHGNEYQYKGEPVYIENEGRIVQKGVIEDIIHEETHTALILGHDHATTMEYHPDEERREEYIENKVEWYDRDCPECGDELHICESWEGEYDGEIKCHNCDTELSITEDREVLVV